jgi:glycine/D-amino acid oxidase-like deaminating enzyme
MALPDVVIIGAGVVGAACAFYAARAGLSVVVLDRGPVAGGTTGVGQGAVLASDKPLGAALDLALESLRLWEELAAELGAGRLELARRGGLAVAASDGEFAALRALAVRQRAAGVPAVDLPAAELRGHEPRLAEGLAGAVRYPDDLQVDPVHATAHLLRASGAEVRCGVDVRGMELSDGRVTGVRTASGERLGCAAVVNAAGVWAGDVSAMAGTPLPVRPRRGFVLVTEALTGARTRRSGPPRPSRAPRPPIRHTVYAAGYAATVADAGQGLQVSVVVTGGRAGAVHIGGSRERVGFDASWPMPVLRELAAGAVRLFPFLAEVSAVRAYRGFRPDTPDRLPIIGPDPWVAGLYHACGHEGAGVCLAPATGALTARMLTAEPVMPDPFAFHPERFG